MTISKRERKVSEKELGEQQSASVYDFLYCDTRRISTFLAQFDDSGTLQKLIQSEEASLGTKRGTSISFGGGATLAGTGGQGSFALERAPENQGSEGSFRVYDPLWTNAIVFLDYLENNKLIHRDIEDAPIGSFILASGDFFITDFELIKKVWDLPGMRANVLKSQKPKGNRKERRSAASISASLSKPSEADETNTELGYEFVKVLPHVCHAELKEGSRKVWGSLSDEYLTVEKSDIFLKHGRRIPGTWYILGVLDARPFEGSFNRSNELPENYNALIHGFGCVIDTFAPLVRQALGRPDSAYGVTPLLVFREIERGGGTDET